MKSESLVLMSRDAILVRKMAKVATQTGLDLLFVNAPAAWESETPPSVLVVDLEMTGAIEAIIAWKKRWPDSFVAGSIRLPDQERWMAASAAGCDLVSNIGALPDLLSEKLLARESGVKKIPTRLRLPVKTVENPGDGLVGRVPDAPDGVIAIFRLRDKLCAFRDVCPHAGFAISDGAFDPENGVLTCPGHGSQFHICSGERMRGPADFPVKTYRVVLDNSGKMFIEI